MPEDYLHLMAAAAKAHGLNPPAIVLPADRYVRLNGLTFHYLDWGNDHLPHVVLLHGGGLNAHTWDMAALLLRDRYHLVALDQRGNGDSDWTPHLDDDTARLMVRDAADFVDSLGYERIALVGMSRGGLNAMLYAGGYQPKCVEALVIVDVGPSNGTVRAGSRRGEQVLGRFEDFVEQAVAANPLSKPDHLRYSLFHALRPTPDGRWTWKEDRRPRPPMTEEEERAANRQFTAEQWDAVRAIRTPTLLMRGARSKVLSLEAAHRLVGELPSARLVEIPDAGHSIQTNNPRAFARELDAFLTETISRPSGSAG